MLDGLGHHHRDLNIVSKEQNVKDVLPRSTLGEADAGFVYVTDAQAAGDKVKSIELPADAQGDRHLSRSVSLTELEDQEAAQRWIDLVMSSDGQQVLQELRLRAAAFELIGAGAAAIALRSS